MEAEHNALVNLVCELDELVPYKETLSFLLANPHVVDPCRFAVLKGSGMGAQFSSDLCDLAFHRLVERHFLNLQAKVEYGLLLWLRCLDDILCFVVATRQGTGLAAHIRSLAVGVWQIKVEEASKNSVSFLDLALRKTPAGTLDLSLFVKPTATRIPLASDPSHPKFTRNWPRGKSVVSRCFALGRFPSKLL